MGPALQGVKPQRVPRRPVGAIIVAMRSILRLGARGARAAAWLALAGATSAVAMPPTASRVELQRWFASLQQSHEADLGAARTWTFTFVAASTGPLESLWRELVRDGYRLVALDGSGMPSLRVMRVELHSPATLVQRNQSLTLAAHRHGARYVSFDVARSDAVR